MSVKKGLISFKRHRTSETVWIVRRCIILLFLLVVHGASSCLHHSRYHPPAAAAFFPPRGITSVLAARWPINFASRKQKKSAQQ